MKQRHGKIKDKEIIDAYYKHKTLGKIAHALSIPMIQVWRRCKKLGLTFKNGGHNKGLGRIRFELRDILEGKYPQYPTNRLKKRILEEKIFPYCCAVCNITEWNNKQLVLQLDYIDGKSTNHVLENLRLLCPNCHSQTDTYCGKNKNEC